MHMLKLELNLARIVITFLNKAYFSVSVGKGLLVQWTRLILKRAGTPSRTHYGLDLRSGSLVYGTCVTNRSRSHPDLGFNLTKTVCRTLRHSL
jgi:hypothetical protein